MTKRKILHSDSQIRLVLIQGFVLSTNPSFPIVNVHNGLQHFDDVAPPVRAPEEQEGDKSRRNKPGKRGRGAKGNDREPHLPLGATGNR